jgi:LmbE family N-acetylglucosaminyl deacetylase
VDGRRRYGPTSAHPTHPVPEAPVLAFDDIRRVLVVTAHPDDVDFGAGGTVALLTEAGAEVAYCIATDGDAGGFDPSVPRRDIPGIRRAEQTAAGAVLGVTDLTFLGFRDGQLTVSLDLRRDIARQIRRVRPDVVICMSPVRNFDRVGISHPDHLAAGEAAMCAVYPDARNEFAFTELMAEGLAPHVTAETWIMGHPEPDLHVDITDVLDRKLAAIEAHDSQVTDVEGMRARVREWVTTTAAGAGLPDGRAAESFRRMPTA